MSVQSVIRHYYDPRGGMVQEMTHMPIRLYTDPPGLPARRVVSHIRYEFVGYTGEFHSFVWWAGKTPLEFLPLVNPKLTDLDIREIKHFSTCEEFCSDDMPVTQRGTEIVSKRMGTPLLW